MPLGSFDHKEFVKWKFDTGCQRFNLLPELAFGQGSVLVEEGGNELRVNDHHEDGEDEHKEPEIDEEVLPAHLDDLDDRGHQGQHDDLESQHLIANSLSDTPTLTLLTWETRNFLIWSLTKNSGVCLLNPCFCSSTKVE